MTETMYGILDQAKRDTAPIEHSVIVARDALELTHRIQEVIDGATSIDDVLCAMVDDGAWVADESICPIADWINTVMPGRFDEVNFDFPEQGRAAARVELVYGRSWITLPLPELLSRIAWDWERYYLTGSIAFPGDFGFEFIDGSWCTRAKPKAA